MAEIDLATEAGIADALARVRSLRMLGDLASPDDRRWLLDIAERALRRLRPEPQPATPDTRDVPPWLRALQEKLQEDEDRDVRR
jgi:hypothetical protein